jgi:hypothetical protein
MWEDPIREVLALVQMVKYENPSWQSATTNQIRDAFRKHLLMHNATFTAKEIPVSNRGDGRGGRVDLFFCVDGKDYAIEFDKCTPKKKSVFKLRSLGPEVFKIIILKYGAFTRLRKAVGDDIRIIIMDLSKDLSLNQMGLSKDARRRVSARRWAVEAEYLRSHADEVMQEIRQARAIATKDTADYRSRPRYKKFRRLMMALARNRCARCSDERPCSQLDLHIDPSVFGREEIEHCEILCRPCYARILDISRP